MVVTEKKELNGLGVADLLAIAQERKEGVFSSTNAFSVVTGKRTGRSPRDRFIVCDDITRDQVDWGQVNQSIEPDAFSRLWSKAHDYMQSRERFVNELQVGADARYALPVKVITEFAWHNVFCQHLFINPRNPACQVENEWTLLNAATLAMDPAVDGTPDDGVVIINFTERKVLLCGMRYAGEMKKALFTALNFILPQRDVLPMHCASNVGTDGDVALFFGLSGTGKTTLSADPSRFLIGDDEHGWGTEGVFNFEGGCYAKCINLSKEREPVIWDAIRDGAILENVVLNDAGEPDYDNAHYSLNSRSGYPRTHIPKRVEENQAGQPQAVLFLTCDLYGVLPPISVLNIEQAAYYFLSGYTALVGSTEVGSTEGIKPTFSTCFGAPFFPRAATVYAELLMKRVRETGARVYLVNTGWTGGAYGEGGQRFSIPVTRRVVEAAISNELAETNTVAYPGFNFAVPTTINGVDSALLRPDTLWTDSQAYREKANLLIAQFQNNFKRFDVSESITNAGPCFVE